MSALKIQHVEPTWLTVHIYWYRHLSGTYNLLGINIVSSFQELGVVQDSLQTLKRAQVKFQDSKESLDKITPASQGNPIMVPLTDSMYVEGKVADADKVIVDIGTGFYVEKKIPDAQDYFKRRVAFVTQQMEKLQFIGTEKMKIRDGKF